MGVFALGLNHTTAPLDLRAKFAFPLDRLAPTLQTLRQRLEPAARSVAAPAPAGGPVAEAALLSTCNRTELYVAGDVPLVQPAIDWLAGVGGISGRQLLDHAYVLEDGLAARHAFRVASGLDSMVLGEPQILGQMKQAVREADTAGTLGSTLHQMFQRSFAVAKEVRTATEIGAHSISMAAASVRLASQLFEDLRSIKVLFVGAGEMIELVATHFAAKSPRQMAVANRTAERGERLAQRLGAESLRLADLPTRLAEFDAVVSCTASTLPIIGLGAVERALKQRRRRPIFMVDLAVPRDIEPEVAQLGDVYLYTVDDLSTLVQSAGEKRQAAVQQAETIIETGVRGFVQWMGERSTVPLIQALHGQAEAWRAAELARARKLLARGEPVDAVLEALARGLTQKMLHGPLASLRAADGPQRDEAAQAVARMLLQPGRAASGGPPRAAGPSDAES